MAQLPGDCKCEARPPETPTMGTDSGIASQASQFRCERYFQRRLGFPQITYEVCDVRAMAAVAHVKCDGRASPAQTWLAIWIVRRAGLIALPLPAADERER